MGGFLSIAFLERQVADAQVEDVIVRTLESTPRGATHWSTRSMAVAAGMSRMTVQRIWKAFEESGRAGRRPPLDPALAALGTALDGKQPVVFEADRLDRIEHVLDFAAEFRIKPILYGGRDAWKVADRLAREQVPVILRLNFTEEPTGDADERPAQGTERRRPAAP